MTWKGILVYVENYEEKPNMASFELLSKASELKNRIGGDVSAVVLSTGKVHEIGEMLISYGADKVIVYNVHSRELLANQLIHRDVVIDAIREMKPRSILISATPWGRSLGPRIAAKLQTGITADCLDIYVDEQGDIVQVRPAFTGNIIAHIKTLTNPVITTIRPKVFSIPKPDYLRKGEIIVKDLSDVEISDDVGKIKVTGISRAKEVKLADASIIVTVGKALRSKDDLRYFQEFARLIGGELGCSKPLVDAGWCVKDRQVGFSGNIVRPKIYIALGISGAPQHIAGMKDSEYVIAINVDESAPISRYSDLFIVGDMYNVVAKVFEVIKSSKSQLGS